MKLSKKSIIISGVVLVLIIGGGAFYAYNTPAELLVRGNKYLQTGKYSDAISSFQQVIAKDPKNIQAMMGLEQTYVITKDFYKAEIMLKEVEQVEPKNVQVREDLFQVYLKESKLDLADAILHEISQIDPKIDIKQMNSDLDSAKVISASKASYDQGIQQMNDKQYLEAMTSFQKVIKEDTERYADAQAKIDVCKKSYLDDTLQQARDAAANKDYKSALTYLEQIIKVDPSNQDALKLKNDYSRIYDIYPLTTNSEKKALITFLSNFGQSHGAIDVKKFSDADLLDIAVNNMIGGVIPRFTVVNGIEDKIDSSTNWNYKPYSAKEVDKYIFDMFGVVPNKMPEYTIVSSDGVKEVIGMYENGYYYFIDASRGGYWSATQVTKMYALDDKLQYVEFTIYDFTDGSIKDYSWDHTQSLEPIANWTDQTKSYAEKVTKSGYAIIHPVVIDGKNTWNLVKFETGGSFLSDEELKGFQQQ